MKYITNNKQFLFTIYITFTIIVIINSMVQFNYITITLTICNITLLFIATIKPILQKQIYLTLVIINSITTLLILLDKNQIDNYHLNIIIYIILPWLISYLIINKLNYAQLAKYIILFVLLQFTANNWQVLAVLFFSWVTASGFIKSENTNNVRIYITQLIMLATIVTIALFASLNLNQIQMFLIIMLELTICIIGIITWGQTPFVKTIILIVFIYLLLNAILIVKILV